MTRLRTFLLPVILLSTLNAMGQIGYVVTFRGDTIRGEIRLSYDLNRVDIRPINPNVKKVSFPALQVRIISLDGEFYQTLRNDGSFKFMKLLKSGYLSLYAFREPNQVHFDGRIIAKRDGTSMEVPNFMFKKVMTGYLKDCENVATKIKDDQLKRSQIDQIVDEYNACIESFTEKLHQPETVSKKPEYILLESLTQKVNALPEFANKKNTLDLLKDIHDKMMNAQPVPAYLIEGLKNYLGTNEATKEDLEKLTAALKVD